MFDSKFIELKFKELLIKQQKSEGIKRYIFLAEIFDFLSTHIITIKKDFPTLYSSCFQKAIIFRTKIIERLNDTNINPEYISIYQECLTLLNSFELSLKL